MAEDISKITLSWYIRNKQTIQRINKWNSKAIIIVTKLALLVNDSDNMLLLSLTN